MMKATISQVTKSTTYGDFVIESTETTMQSHHELVATLPDGTLCKDWELDLLMRVFGPNFSAREPSKIRYETFLHCVNNYTIATTVTFQRSDGALRPSSVSIQTPTDVRDGIGPIIHRAANYAVDQFLTLGYFVGEQFDI